MVVFVQVALAQMGSLDILQQTASRSQGDSPRVSTQVAMQDKANATDYKFSLVRADVSINLALPLYQIAPMESDGMM